MNVEFKEKRIDYSNLRYTVSISRNKNAEYYEVTVFDKTQNKEIENTGKVRGYRAYEYFYYFQEKYFINYLKYCIDEEI